MPRNYEAARRDLHQALHVLELPPVRTHRLNSSDIVWLAANIHIGNQDNPGLTHAIHCLRILSPGSYIMAEHLDEKQSDPLLSV